MEETQNLPILDSVEIRVLGALMEKSVTTPDYYPMTLNSLTAACNQKSSRKPVVEYDEETVVLALNSLKARGLIATATGGGSRTVKYKHNFTNVYPVLPAEYALICLLFLRGPQTPGELNTNSTRLYEFESIEQVHEVLDRIANTVSPFVKTLPRRVGQKEIRYTHLFSGNVDVEEEELPEEPARKSVNDLEVRLALVEQKLATLKVSFEKLMKELLG